MPEDFQRHPTNGAPYVNHPTKLTAKGRPCRVMYGRPSNLGSQVENRFAIEKWSERMLLCGAARVDLSGVDQLDPDDEDDRTQLDGLAVKCKEEGGAYVAASRGTLMHSVTEMFDRDEACPLEMLQYGEDLGLPGAVVDALTLAYARCLERFDIHVLAAEHRVVDDRWRVAGTLDRIVRLGQELSFEGLTIPAGTVLVLDIKTGRLHVDSKGRPDYWHGFCVQVASYAHSAPYYIDGLHEERGEWPWEISQRHGLVCHIDINNALEEGVATVGLYHLDLVAGHMAGNLARAARDWQNRTDIVRSCDEPPVAVSVR